MDRETKANELRRMNRNLTQLRDRAAADGNREVAEHAIDASHAVMEELRELYRQR